MYDNVYVRETVDKGRGVFASSPFYFREMIMEFTGPIKVFDEVEDHGLYLQVAENRFLGSSGNPDDYVNHSCDPNAGILLVENTPFLIAIRDIEAHEELTFDYSTCMNDGYWEMICACKSPRCRGHVTDFKGLPIHLQQRYIALGIVAPFITGGFALRGIVTEAC